MQNEKKTKKNWISQGSENENNFGQDNCWFIFANSNWGERKTEEKKARRLARATGMKKRGEGSANYRCESILGGNQ